MAIDSYGQMQQAAQKNAYAQQASLANCAGTSQGRDAYAAGIQSAAVARPVVTAIFDELSQAIARIYEQSQRLEGIAARLGGQRPECPSDGQCEPPPAADLFSQLRSLTSATHRLGARMSETISHIESLV